MNYRTAFSLALVGVLAFGCKGDSSTDVQPPTEIQLTELRYEPLTDTTTTGVVNAIAAIVPSIRISDARTNTPMPNVTVEFRTVGGGSVAVPTTKTNSEGIASAGQWQLGPDAVSTSVEAVSGGRVRATFIAKAIPGVPYHIKLVDDDYPAEVVGIPLYIWVRVEDQFGNPIPDVPITFAAADGILAPAYRATTYPNGRAQSGQWFLDVGSNQMTVSASGLPPITVTARGLDGTTLQRYALGEVTGFVFDVHYARFALTPFDKCLCGKQEGYFVEQVEWGIGEYGDGWRVVGHYELNGDRLFLSQYTSTSGIVKGDTVTLERPALFGGVEKWVYLLTVP